MSKIYTYFKRVIFIIGLYKVGQPFCSMAHSFFNQFLREHQSNIPNSTRIIETYGGNNAYAIITGASDGMGKVQALQLAKYGFNLVIMSRSQDKLDVVTEQCKSLNPKIQVTTIPIDFSKAEPQDYKTAFQEGINDKNVRILINNVGIIDKVKFLDLSPEYIENLIKVNIFSQVFMTKYAMLLMNKNKSKPNRNALVHYSSFVGDNILPFHGEYGATKRFNKVFGQMNDFYSNFRSCDKSAIDTLIVKPAGVVTAMNSYYSDPGFTSPESVVNGVFRELGYSQETNGAFKHVLMGNSMKYLPDIIFHPIKQQLGNADKALYE